jgi:membrane-bound inhibitor of C-type lysozyme
MKNRIIWIVVILAVLAGAVFVLRKPSPSVDTKAFVNSVDYFCDAGTISAVYTDGNVALTLSDGRSLSLPQAVSGSGIRYETGATSSDDIVFSSEGANAFLTENNNTTYNNCISGTTSVSGSSTLFTDSAKTFSLAYPSMFMLSGGGVGYTQSWRVNATTSGMILAHVDIPRSYMPMTNFSEAKFTVGVSSDPSAVASCLTPQNGEVSAGTQSIGGTTFTKITLGDAGAGNFYDTTSYRAVKNNQCYAVEYTIHSSNIGNYSPDQGIKEFDKTQIQGILDTIAQSFKFL